MVTDYEYRRRCYSLLRLGCCVMAGGGVVGMEVLGIAAVVMGEGYYLIKFAQNWVVVVGYCTVGIVAVAVAVAVTVAVVEGSSMVVDECSLKV